MEPQEAFVYLLQKHKLLPPFHCYPSFEQVQVTEAHSICLVLQLKDAKQYLV